MEMPGLALILAKTPLPAEAQCEIKKFLQLPTPTARLMKQLTFEIHEGAVHSEVYVVSRGRLSFHRIHVEWSSGPLRPALLYKHVAERVSELAYSWHEVTGEPRNIAPNPFVKVIWPWPTPPGGVGFLRYSYNHESVLREQARRLNELCP
jgi:hypothetical protein